MMCSRAFLNVTVLRFLFQDTVQSWCEILAAISLVEELGSLDSS